MGLDRVAVALIAAGILAVLVAVSQDSIYLGLLAASLSLYGAGLLVRAWVPMKVTLVVLVLMLGVFVASVSPAFAVGFQGEHLFGMSTQAWGTSVFFYAWVLLMGGALFPRTRGWGRACVVSALAITVGLPILSAFRDPYVVALVDVPVLMLGPLLGALAWLGLRLRTQETDVRIA